MSDRPRADVSAFRRAASTLAGLGDGVDAVLAADGALDAAEVALPLLDASPFGALPEVALPAAPAVDAAGSADAPRLSRAPAPPAAPRPRSTPAAAPPPARPQVISRGDAAEAAATTTHSPSSRTSGDASRPAPSAPAPAPRTATAPVSGDASRRATGAGVNADGVGDSGDGTRARQGAGRHTLDGSIARDASSGNGPPSPAVARTPIGAGSAADAPAQWADAAALVAAILSAEAANAGSAALSARMTQPWRGAVRAFRGAGAGLGAMPGAADALLASDAVLATADAALPLADASPFDAVSAEAVPQPRERNKDGRRADAAAKRREWPEPPVAPTRRPPVAPDAPRRDRIAQPDAGSRAAEPKPATPRGGIAPAPEAATSDARPVHRLGRRPAGRTDATPAQRGREGDAAGPIARPDAARGREMDVPARPAPRGREMAAPARPAPAGVGIAQPARPADRASDPLARLSRAAGAELLDRRDGAERLGHAAWEDRGDRAEQGPAGERRTLLADLSDAVLRVSRAGDGRIATPKGIAPEVGPPLSPRAATTLDALRRPLAARVGGADASATHSTAEPGARGSSAVAHRPTSSAISAAAPHSSTSQATAQAAHPSAPVAGSRAGRAPAAGAAARAGSLRLVDTLARSILAARVARESALAARLARIDASPSPATAVRTTADAPEPPLAPLGGWGEAHAGASSHSPHISTHSADPAAAALDAVLHAEPRLPAPATGVIGAAKHSTGHFAFGELPLEAGMDAQAALDPGALASLVNDALVEQALRHGVDLS